VGTASLRPVRVFAAVGLVGALLAAALDPAGARAAVHQNWPPFVLVIGLLLVGLVANRDGLFNAAGGVVAARANRGLLLYAGAVLVIAVVTAVLNRDTAVAFLTPVLIYTARQRGGGEGVLLYGSLLLANAASLLLPGSNLTNLIVLGHLHLSGHAFFVRMAPAWVAAVTITAAVVGVMHRRDLRHVGRAHAAPKRIALGLSAVAILATVVLVVMLRNPALPVLAVGLAAVVIRMSQRRLASREVISVLGLPALAGLFGVAIALGTAGRAWSAPQQLLAHADRWGTAFAAAAIAVLVNNLPAASLLAARVPHHPFALLIGLNLGPNLCVTGSLAWLLWLRAARSAGARPSLLHATRLGLVAAPLSIAAAVAALSLSSSP
jgi:arsenical pump membrane protein